MSSSDDQVGRALDAFRAATTRSAAARARSRAALQARLASSAPPEVPPASAAGGSMLARLAGGLFLTATVLLVGLGAWRSRPPRAAAPSPVLRAANAPAVPAPLSALPAPAPAVVAPALAAPEALREEPPARATTRQYRVSNHVDTSPTLDEELGLLREVNTALTGHDGARALSLLDAFAATHRGGALLEERRAARLVARCQLRPTAALRAEAERFASDNPRSPQLRRIQRACQDSSEALAPPH